MLSAKVARASFMLRNVTPISSSCLSTQAQKHNFQTESAKKSLLSVSSLKPFFFPSNGFSTSKALKSIGSDHGKMWNLERVVSAAQIPIVIVPFIWTTPVGDAIFCTLAVIHSHWGLEAIVVDYIRPSLFNGNTLIPNISHGLIWVFSGLALGGLYYFNYTDIGIVNAIKMLWTV